MPIYQLIKKGLFYCILSFSSPSGYATFIRNNPCGGTAKSAFTQFLLSIASLKPCTDNFSLPTRNIVPTIPRTIPRKNLLAVTLYTIRSSFTVHADDIILQLYVFTCVFRLENVIKS